MLVLKVVSFQTHIENDFWFINKSSICLKHFCLFEYIIDLLLGSNFGKDVKSKITIKKKAQENDMWLKKKEFSKKN
jgi:hypothetical protein